MGKHILVISQYFFPEQFRINDICTEWVKRGYKVTVITGIPNYPEGKYYKGYGLFKKRKETYNGVDIIRIPLIPRGKSKIMLGLNYLSFVISGFFWKTFTRIKADLVFIFEVSPMTQALPGVWYAKRRKIPCFLYVTDLWPENVISVSNIKKGLVIRMIERMVGYIYRRCTRILVSSERFISAISDRGIPEDKMLFWPYYAEDIYKKVPYDPNKVPEIPHDDKLNLIYAGNIGVAQGLEILPRCARVLKDRGVRVRFNIVGDGRYKETLISTIRELDVDDMFNFVDKQPIERIPHFMASCDAAIICLAKSPVLEMTIPSKFQSVLACGIPIVASGDGEIKKLIEKSGAGFVSPSGDPILLSEAIIRMNLLTSKEITKISKSAIEYSSVNFNKDILLDEIDRLFDSVNE